MIDLDLKNGKIIINKNDMFGFVFNYHANKLKTFLDFLLENKYKVQKKVQINKKNTNLENIILKFIVPTEEYILVKIILEPRKDKGIYFDFKNITNISMAKLEDRSNLKKFEYFIHNYILNNIQEYYYKEIHKLILSSQK